MTAFGNKNSRALPDFKRLYIFGAGGSGREVAWLSERLWDGKVELVFIVDLPGYPDKPVNGIPVRQLAGISASGDERFVAAIGDCTDRRKVVGRCEQAGLRPTALIDRNAEVSRWVELRDGSIVCAGSIITTNIVIGPHVHVNVGCTISHDVSIGAFSTLSPGVHVSGHVRIGEGVFIGTGASIINGRLNDPLVIGDAAVVAAGACVTESVAPQALVAGVPAIRKR